MRLTQKSLLQPTWEYEIADGRLVIRERSPSRLHESFVPLAAIDPAARTDSSTTFRYLALVALFSIPVVSLGVTAIRERDGGFLVFALFFLPFLVWGLYRFFATKYDHLVFDTYEGNEKSSFRMRRDNPSRAQVERFLTHLKAEAKKIRYRDDLPDDKKLELVQRHLEFLQHVEILTESEVADLTARARKRFMEGKVVALNPAANSPMGS